MVDEKVREGRLDRKKRRVGSERVEAGWCAREYRKVGGG